MTGRALLRTTGTATTMEPKTVPSASKRTIMDDTARKSARKVSPRLQLPVPSDTPAKRTKTFLKTQSEPLKVPRARL